LQALVGMGGIMARGAIARTAALLVLIAGSGCGHEEEARSVGRGWPVTETQVRYVSGGMEGAGEQASWDGPPAGVTPLPVDLFTTRDFYQDEALWSDPRYFRCNSPATLQAMWGADALTSRRMIGTKPPQGASWGHCEIDYPRAAIVSPYPFKTAQEHYEALLAETRARGGPTIYTRENPPPDWNGRYSRAISLQFMAARDGGSYQAPAHLAEPPQWFFTAINQTSTILSLLTPEYRRRTVQMHYHQSVDNAPLWPAQFCWPEGFMRLFSRQAHLSMDFVTMPGRVELMASSADNFIRHFNIGRSFNMSGKVPRLGADVPRWYGESIGFWDHDTLITWTSNIIPWITHGVFEFSGKLQTIEIFSPRRAPDGSLAGIQHEIVLYDPDAFVQPLRMIQVHIRTGDLDKVDPFIYARCMQTIFPVDGRPKPVSPGTTIPYTVPDLYGRPWARIWEKYLEKGMKRPREDELFKFGPTPP
jgi:hypothetical protein